MIQTRKNLVLGLAALTLALGASTLAKADTIVQGPQSFGPFLTDSSGNFVFNKFDPSLGSLQSVKVDLGLGFSTTITVTNSGTDASSGNVRTEVQAGVTDTGTFSTPSNILTITGGNTNVLIDALSPNQGYALGAGQSTTLVPISGSGSATGTFTSGAVLAEFTGLGTISMPWETFTQTVLANTGGNTTASQVTNATISGTLTYTYNAAVIPGTPEPGSVAMVIGMGVTGMAFAYRRRRAKK